MRRHHKPAGHTAQTGTLRPDVIALAAHTLAVLTAALTDPAPITACGGWFAGPNGDFWITNETDTFTGRNGGPPVTLSDPFPPYDQTPVPRNSRPLQQPVSIPK